MNIILIIIKIKIFRSLKSVLCDFKVLILKFYFSLLSMQNKVKVPYITASSSLAKNLLASQQKLSAFR
jgi:hypothetical protein